MFIYNLSVWRVGLLPQCRHRCCKHHHYYLSQLGLKLFTEVLLGTRQFSHFLHPRLFYLLHPVSPPKNTYTYHSLTHLSDSVERKPFRYIFFWFFSQTTKDQDDFPSPCLNALYITVFHTHLLVYLAENLIAPTLLRGNDREELKQMTKCSSTRIKHPEWAVFYSWWIKIPIL